MAAAAKMSLRLKDLLAYAYLHKDMAFTAVDLQEVLEEVQGDLSLLIEEKKARIHADSLPAVRSIRHQLHQLFFNLVCNALKYSKADGSMPHIRITVRPSALLSNRKHQKVYW